MSSAKAQRPIKTKVITRVLVADDNRDNLVTLGILLRSEGYVVHLAKDGKEALKLGTTFRPDVALLDLLMPERTGFDVAEELQRHYPNECPVLIAITAHGTAQNKEQAVIS